MSGIIQLSCANCKTPVVKELSQYKKSKSGNVFCGRSCSAVFNNKKPKRQRKTKCKTCQIPIRAGYTYCTKCFSNRLVPNRTLESVMESKNDANRYGKVRQNAQLVYRQSGMSAQCLLCGYSTHVEICHIKNISDFPTNTLVSEINNLSNLVALCRNHHWEFDHNCLSPEDLQKIHSQ